MVNNKLQILSNIDVHGNTEVPNAPIFINEIAGIVWINNNYPKQLYDIIPEVTAT